MHRFVTAISLSLASLLSLAATAEPVLQTVHPIDNGAALENPGMGWVFHHYDNSLGGYGAPLGSSYDGREFPGLTVVYLRLAWSHLEPEEGRFCWSILDTPIQRYALAGKRFALRFTVFEGDPEQGTPNWVRQAGAKGQMAETYGKQNWEPDYDDPVFLAKLADFLDAAGRRYGSSPGLAFLDVGTLGIWGEGHAITGHYGLETMRRHIEMHRHAFPHALLVANDDWSKWFRDADPSKAFPLDLARDWGLTFRDDTLCVYADPKQDYSAALAQPFWPIRPVIMEMGHYTAAKAAGAWEGGSRYYQAVEDYHGSYLSIHANPHEFLAENADLIRRINLRLGYRLQLIEASWPTSVKKSAELLISSRWRNAGVAPCLPGGRPTWSLFNGKGDLCAVLTDDWNLSKLSPGTPGNGPAVNRDFHVTLPVQINPGDYELCISVGDPDGTPRIAIPLDGDNGHHRYPIGHLQVIAE